MKGNREKLFVKQKGLCAMCGVQLHINKENCFDKYYLQIDHVKPKSLGGKSHISNYRGLCKPCNSSKKNTSGDKLINMIIKQQKGANLTKYQTRIKDDYKTNNIDKRDLKLIKNELIKNYNESLEVINELLKDMK